jgi:transcription antitermination factor NusG
MSANINVVNSVAAVPKGVDDAVGVGKKQWFIAIVNRNSEKMSAERLDRLGVENYLPTQTVVRVWKNGKKKTVVKVELPAIIFIHCSEKERREVVKLPFIFRFMTDKAGKSGGLSKPLATVSDAEIKRLKFMLCQSDVPVEIVERPYQTGDKVRVTRGSLVGLEGEVLEMSPSKSVLTVSLKYFGCAKLVIDTVNLELLNN